MYPYQQQYQPSFRQYRVGQPAPAAPPAPAPVPAVSAPVPTGPSAGVKVAETLITLGFTGAVVYTGVRVGMKEKSWNSAAGWVAGVGGGLLGLAALTAIVSPTLAAKVMPPFRFA